MPSVPLLPGDQGYLVQGDLKLHPEVSPALNLPGRLQRLHPSFLAFSVCPPVAQEERGSTGHLQALDV